jgi:hypothetical protein
LLPHSFIIRKEYHKYLSRFFSSRLPKPLLEVVQRTHLSYNPREMRPRWSRCQPRLGGQYATPNSSIALGKWGRGERFLKCLMRSRRTCTSHSHTAHLDHLQKMINFSRTMLLFFYFFLSFSSPHLCFPNLFSRSCNRHTSLIIQERCASAGQDASRAWGARMPPQTVP